MKLDKDNVKKIRGLILFTVFVLVALWNYELVFDGVLLFWKVIFPFVLGGAIAFLVNIPMNFLLTNPDIYLNKSDTYYLYCEYGSRSKGVCEKLSRKGYNVINISGGFSRQGSVPWQRRVCPLLKKGQSLSC